MNFNRRRLFSVLAALPAVGVLFSSSLGKAIPAASTGLSVGSGSLARARDILLPGLWSEAKAHPDLEFDIMVDFQNEALLVKGYSLSKKRLLGFAITRASIIDGHYKASFRPSLLALVRLLTQEDLPHGVS
jgi:hypothetical protein